MTVTPEERDAMLRLRNIMEGNNTPAARTSTASIVESAGTVELAGPGQVTNADISAMANVLQRLNSISNNVVDDMITESVGDIKSADALMTEKISNGIKVGRYQILTKEDPYRIAGKQFYSIYNSLTNDTIADDITLYETAISVVRLLNSGKFTNDTTVRKLFELDDSYTSHKVDAITYKRRINSSKDQVKKDIYESRLQASMDRCMFAKKALKSLSKQCL
jgi:hypothetical protein